MLIINKKDVKEKIGHCGLIKKLTSDNPARIIHLVVRNAERHFHKVTTEYYYVLNGKGKLFLDGELHEIEKDDLIKIEPGVLHQAIEEDESLEILVIEIPPAIDDVYYQSV
jgi:mannose-6-phosphate isomerase-like protein (cupin superfamily)